MCTKNQWIAVLTSIRNNSSSLLSTSTKMKTTNHIPTTILHQAITSRGDATQRYTVIKLILDRTPLAASVKNGYGSYPLHVINQRNTKMDSTTKQRIIRELIHAYPAALTEKCGKSRRTPLHIVFTGSYLLFFLVLFSFCADVCVRVLCVCVCVFLFFNNMRTVLE